ncbi:hypothetical protein GWI33_004357 [Rhynchophorus ferrugineus]|uniref:Uncharacterized protein n=1 Tax=Rhynchophorus ferrugineus TaxID=354439 RepID=A0A834ISY0_RHYFE|nr:hypothetical protein GWI33_004357 [Rhynchophorus ferrugineus]
MYELSEKKNCLFKVSVGLPRIVIVNIKLAVKKTDIHGVFQAGIIGRSGPIPDWPTSTRFRAELPNSCPCIKSHGLGPKSQIAFDYPHRQLQCLS